MLKVLAVVVVALLIAVIPVMLAARIVGAGKHGFGASLLAVILQGILSVILRTAKLDTLLIFVIAVVVGSAIYAHVLDTSLLRGFVLSIVATVITVVIVLGLASIFALGLAIS